MSGVLLGFDTATPATTAAVLAPDGRIAERRHDPAPDERPAHAGQLLALAAEALAAAGTTWEQVGRLAVGTGPGTFTGLRIGIATARALAQGLGAELVGVSTLRALAAHAADAPGAPVLAVLDARRGEAFAAAWAGERELLAPCALAPDALAGEVAAVARSGGGPPLAIGDGAVKFRAWLEPAGATVPADGSPIHRVSAAAICRLAAGMQAADRDAVLPDYLRLPDAEIAHRRRR